MVTFKSHPCGQHHLLGGFFDATVEGAMLLKLSHGYSVILILMLVISVRV